MLKGPPRVRGENWSGLTDEQWGKIGKEAHEEVMQPGARGRASVEVRRIQNVLMRAAKGVKEEETTRGKERAAEEHGARTRRESVRARSELGPKGCAITPLSLTLLEVDRLARLGRTH